VLARGDEAERRLGVVESVHGPDTRAFLERAGLRAGMRVADLGCGVGTVACWMGCEMGADVIAIDAGEEQAATASARRDRLYGDGRACPGSTTFLRASIYETGLEGGSFDLVFSRFVLMHLQRPADALAEMRRLLKPGGVLAVEDGDFDSPFCYPPCPAYDRAFELYSLAGARHGADFNIGRKLFGLVTEAGFRDVQVALAQPAVTRGEAKRLPEWTLAECAETLIAEGISTRAEIDSILDELERYAQDETTLVGMARVAQIRARSDHIDP
jgi:SAM-dependent methyltransferase